MIQQGVVSTFVTVKISTDALTIKVTDNSYDVTYNSETYSASGGLLSVTPPGSSSELSRDIFNISVLDPDNAYRVALIEAIAAPVEVMAGFIDITTGGIYPVYLHVYKGIINNVSWEISDDSPIVNISCSGQFAKLKHITNITTSQQSRQNLFPNDTSMNLAYDSTNEVTLKWGSS